MSDFEPDFSYDLAAIDRPLVLAEAARLIENSSQFLDSGGPVTGGTDDAAMVRELIQDAVSLPPYPEVALLTANSISFPGGKRPQEAFAVLSEHYNFYWMAFNVELMPRHNWAFHRLELKVSFNKDETVQSRLPTTHEIFPARKFQQLLQAHTSLKVGLDEALKINAKVGEVHLESALAAAAGRGSLHVSVDANVGVAASLKFVTKKAKIEHSSTGMASVFWRLDGAEFFQEEHPEFIVILRVPKVAFEIRVDVAVQAYRYFNYLGASLQEAVAALPEAIQNYFKGGLPVGSRLQAPWIIKNQKVRQEKKGPAGSTPARLAGRARTRTTRT